MVPPTTRFLLYVKRNDANSAKALLLLRPCDEVKYVESDAKPWWVPGVPMLVVCEPFLGSCCLELMERRNALMDALPGPRTEPPKPSKQPSVQASTTLLPVAEPACAARPEAPERVLDAGILMLV